MSTNTVRLHRVLRATPEKIYRAFLDPDAMAKWLPPNGFTGRVHHIDAKVGGTYKMSFTNFTTGHSHSFGGTYLELVPSERIRHTDKWQSNLRRSTWMADLATHQNFGMRRTGGRTIVINNALAGVAVRNLDSVVAWYGRLLGRPPDFQPMQEVAEWKFPGGGCLQVFQDANRAGFASVTLSVSNLAEHLVQLEASSIRVHHTTASDVVKTAMVTDPDGNQIVFAEALTDTIAR